MGSSFLRFCRLLIAVCLLDNVNGEKVPGFFTRDGVAQKQ